MRRRHFLALLPVALFAGHATFGKRAYAQRLRHPDPRPGISGAKVLDADRLKGYEDLVPIFEGVREFPQVADGIGCACGCAALPEYRSLLTCFEQPGMALVCEICQAQGRLVVRRAREGQSLAQIRAAVDARWQVAEQGEHCP